ncbi:recombinase family protein [Mucilaginibacter aquariorum]|uniref:Recombinase family protein n=1 Tax=Mucilaginibacter aquariorum TaxID=2967225 RepID=A0ABT1SXC0_9SPHI|nr:recombinase family protein [Mucilaginibacter aquariorum]MCQ6956984.1 recombinase family protein [Mucilaginibacter aquariorum]
MKVADLYIRVSTDEQADRGYSQRSQEEVLTRYCNLRDIEIRNIIFEDYSAKTFKRPEWQKFVLDLKKKKGQIDYVLFTKWDRFSRNTGDAYQMINVLKNMFVEPQAIEQPLDMSIPESKLMLAVYLAQPEVDNDRRALNTFYGMRRAKKEGRWMGHALIGYENKIDSQGKKSIVPKEPNASIMRWVFEQLATGNYFIDQIWREARLKGLEMGRKNFWRVIRNPVYCGKIIIPQFKDEEAYLVDGQHEALISESLFYEVLDVLDGRKRKTSVKIRSMDELPLRGFLICPKCGLMLSGSASKGKTKYFHYYHCNSKCGARFNAKLVNEKFIEMLNKYSIEPAVCDLYKALIAEAYDFSLGQGRSEVSNYKKQLNGYQDKIARARDLLLAGDLDGTDYKKIKSDSERQITILEGKLVDSSAKKAGIVPLIDKALNNLSKLAQIYQSAGSEAKRHIVSSMFPQKLTFDGEQHRTLVINEAICVFDSVKAVFEPKKDRKTGVKTDLRSKVTWEGFEPSTH